MPARRPTGFTLVELLVVVAIITVLISLLAPAMDRAVYQGELAVCAANQDGLGAGLLTYAFDHKRSYPYRMGVASNVEWNTHRLTLGTTHQSGRTNPLTILDERKPLKGYIVINKNMQDPMTKKVDLEIDQPESTKFASFDLWYGFHWGLGRKMNRIGDRLTFTSSGVEYRFSLIASDRNYHDLANVSFQTAHPDTKAVLFNHGIQNVSIGAQGGNATISHWIPPNPNTIPRGEIDCNYLFDDGSIQRLTGVGTLPKDKRLIPVPNSNGNPGFGFPNGRELLPPG